MNKYPQLLTDFRVYLEDNLLIGHANLTLPDIEYLTESIKVAGVSGELDMPIIGQTAAMTCTIDWTTICEPSVKLGAPVASMVTARGSQQAYDPNLGRIESQPVTVTMKVMPKKLGLGKMERGTATDSSNDFEVLMIRVLVDDVELAMIDKLNYICRIDGTDYLEAVRANLGMPTAGAGVASSLEAAARGLV